MNRIAAVVIVLGLASCQPTTEPARENWVASVQPLITGSIVIRDEQKVRSTIPYESITIERGPCFGDCPVYKMTPNRDGTALLITDLLLKDRALRYSTKIQLYDYARLARMVEIARSAAPRHEYTGQWTDDFGVTITANSAGNAWQVHDYGQVGPPELWALEEVLHGTRSKLQWAGGVK